MMRLQLVAVYCSELIPTLGFNVLVQQQAGAVLPQRLFMGYPNHHKVVERAYHVLYEVPKLQQVRCELFHIHRKARCLNNFLLTAKPRHVLCSLV